MRKTLKRFIVTTLFATMTIAVMATLSGCASKKVSGTFTLKMSQNVDSEDYNQAYDEGIKEKLYAGTLLGTQTSETDDTLVLKDGNYTLTKEAYMIDHKTDGFDFVMEYKGSYTDNGDGTVTLEVPTSSSRSWYCSDYFVETINTFVGTMAKVEYPTKATASEGVTTETVTNDKDNTINYFFNTAYVNYSTDATSGKLVEAVPQTITLDTKSKSFAEYGTLTTYVTEAPATPAAEATPVPEATTAPEATEATISAGNLVFAKDGKLSGNCGVFPVDSTYTYTDGTLTIADPTFVVTATETGVSIVYDFSTEYNGNTLVAHSEFALDPKVLDGSKLVVLTAADGTISKNQGSLVFGADGKLSGSCGVFPIDTTYTLTDGVLTIADPTFVVTAADGSSTIVYDFSTEYDGNTLAALCSYTISNTTLN